MIGTAGERRRKKMPRARRFHRVGQVFATKSDLLPPQYVAALKSVFDDARRCRKKVDAIGGKN